MTGAFALKRVMPGAMAVVLVATVASAAPITFIGSDVGANSTDPRPGSTAAAASFDAAASGLGTLHVIDFESAPVGPFTSLSLGSGVTLTGVDLAGNSSGQSVFDAPFATPDSAFGYNTTAAGANFAFLSGGSLTFTFDTPIQGFGAYLSGIQLAGETVTYSNGATQTVEIPTISSGIAFVGFTDAGTFITSVTVDTTSASSNLGDLVGLDDLRFVTAGQETAVPEPASLALLGIGLAGIRVIRRGRKRS